MWNDSRGRTRTAFGTRSVVRTVAAVIVLGALCAPAAPVLAAQSARVMYTRALAHERNVRDSANRTTVEDLRAAVRAYEAVVRRFPTSGYSDNALWQAANLALLAYERFGQTIDRRTAIRLFNQLKSGYPSSSLVADADAAAERASAATTPVSVARTAPPVVAAVNTTPMPSRTAVIREIKRVMLPDGVRVSIEMDAESIFHHETLSGPRRVFFDLRNARAAASLMDATLRYSEDVVRQIRLGRHPQNTTRIVMDMEGVEGYSVFTLYNPFRLVVDFRRSAPMPKAVIADEPSVAPVVAATPPPPAAPPPAVPEVKTEPKLTLPFPAEPSVNSNGQFSIARQLGLGISRIVIDAGHGGHDPGARGSGISEAELVLDVATRLRALLQKQPGVEVTMTRETDVFIPLEQRTAIANREGADLFLSIHANASRNTKARGVETYFLNFASNPEAEALAARENSTSARSMHSLPEIVRAIALNNKIDESRDFADMVQKAMVRRLSTRNKQLRDLGVKQAPFVVLIGAGMPSVLAEISFVTNRQEGQLLKTPAYRQQIAEALLDAILRYQKSLKKMNTVASTR